tara:strand:+ start:1635 stop:1937 length:303 start_codon:yes stop_codon:yes gene_type:complete
MRDWKCKHCGIEVPMREDEFPVYCPCGAIGTSFEETIIKPHPLQRMNAGSTKDRPAKGLGDTIAKITHKLGFKSCGGCKKRQAYLNEKFPYKKRDPPNAQ